MDGSDDEFSDWEDFEEAEGMTPQQIQINKNAQNKYTTIINYQHCRSGYDIDTDRRDSSSTSNPLTIVQPTE